MAKGARTPNIPAHLEFVLAADPGKSRQAHEGPVKLTAIVDFPLVHAPRHASGAGKGTGGDSRSVGRREVSLKRDHRRGVLVGPARQVGEAQLASIAVLFRVEPRLVVRAHAKHAMEQHVGTHRPVVAHAQLFRRVEALQPVAQRAGVILIRIALVVPARVEESNVVVGADGMVDFNRPVHIRN